MPTTTTMPTADQAEALSAAFGEAIEAIHTLHMQLDVALRPSEPEKPLVPTLEDVGRLYAIVDRAHEDVKELQRYVSYLQLDLERANFLHYEYAGKEAW